MAAEPKLIATVPRSATEQLQISINEYKGKSYLDMRIYYTMFHALRPLSYNFSFLLQHDFFKKCTIVLQAWKFRHFPEFPCLQVLIFIYF